MISLFRLRVCPKSNTRRNSTKSFDCALIFIFYIQSKCFLWVYYLGLLFLFDFVYLGGGESSTNSCGSIPTKETGLLASINDKLQYYCWTRRLSIGISAAIRVIREHSCVFFVFSPTLSQCPKSVFCSFSYFECNCTTGLNLFWQKLCV